MATGGVSARVAEPFARLHAAHDTRRIVNATEAARPFRSLHVCAMPRGVGGGGGKGGVRLCLVVGEDGNDACYHGGCTC